MTSDIINRKDLSNQVAVEIDDLRKAFSFLYLKGYEHQKWITKSDLEVMRKEAERLESRGYRQI